MAKQTYVYSGTEWVPLASEVTNLTAYQTKALAQASNRNLIINGAMQVAQRGTSVASLTAGEYRTADRFFVAIDTQGTWTNSVENDGPTGSGFAKSLKMLCTTADASPAAGDALNIQQRIEGQNLQQVKKGTAAAEQLTLSFWVKSNVTGTYIAELYDGDNTRQISKSYTISASGTWERKTITFPADTTGAFDNDNALSLYAIWWLGAGSNHTSGTLNSSAWNSVTTANRAVGQVNLASATNNYFQITGVQLEVGDTATPFEFKSAAQDLAECQRYFYKITADTAGSYAMFSTGYIYSGGCETQMNMPVSMRVRPHTFTSSAVGTFYISASTGAGAATSGPTIQRGTNETFQFIVNKTGLTAGQGVQVLQNAADATFVTASAEL